MTATLEKPDAIISLADWDESVNLLIYADSGVGKTVFAGGAGLIIGAEKGTVSAKRQGSKADLWPIKTWSDIQAAYVWLRKNPTAYPWVAIDSVTEMQRKALLWILQKEFKAAGSEGNRDIDIPQIQDHQKWQNMFKRFVTSFCDLPVNVLFTALPLRVEDEEGMELVLPDLQGKGYQIAQWVCAQMSVVGYMKKIRKKTGKEDDKGEAIYRESRRVIFQYRPPYFAKDRYDVLGRYWDDPTLADIDARIKGDPSPPKTPRKTGGTKADASNGSPTRPEPTEPETPVTDEDDDIVLDGDDNEETD